MDQRARELREVAESLAIRNVHVERQFRLRSRFFADMSHELRAPLSSVIGFSELMIAEGRGRLDAEQLERLGTIRASGQHLLGLVNDVLDFAKVESGRISLTVEPVEPGDVIAESVAFVAEAARRRGVTIAPAVRTDARARADRVKLRQVLLNLLSNAIKFSPVGDAVEVGAELVAGRVRFWVRDRGPGVAAAAQAAIFEPFVQLEEGGVAAGAWASGWRSRSASWSATAAGWSWSRRQAREPPSRSPCRPLSGRSRLSPARR